MQNPFEQTCPSAPSTEDDLEILQLLSRLSSDFESTHKNPEYSLPSGISYAEARVLLWFASGPALSVSALASRLNVTPGWASRISAHLLTKGFLKCCQDATDRRVRRLVATKQAIDIVEQVYGEQQRLFAGILSQLQAEERLAVAAFFRRILAQKRGTSDSSSQAPHVSTRRYMVRRCWQGRPFDKQTQDDIPEFYRWLEKNQPRLLRRNCDAYHGLLRDLNGCILQTPVDPSSRMQ